MVNNTSFAKRLQKICDEYELSAAAFAEKVNVGRATISHILSGRNKPSLDFVMKVTSSFPEVDLYWFLYGRGVFPKTEDTSVIKIESVSTTPITSKAISKDPADVKQTTPTTQNTNTAVFEKNPEQDLNTQKIKRVLIFFEDGHFESYDS
ncbi:MAG: transcriptional regulator with XRE-family HTH domain [Flavobacteriales bacterium]|jgi:transcriptional regulator with XRE-family HTH domain